MDIDEQIRKVRDGDVNSFEPVIREYQQNIFAFCYFMLGHRQEAEDAVQDVFFKAYRHLPTYRFEQSFLAWLYKISANHCKTVLKRKRKWSLLLPLFRTYDREISAEQSFVDQNGTEISQWLIGLSPAEKEILILRVLEDQSFEMIAELLGSKPATVRKRFERLRKKLRTKHEGDTDYEQTCRI